MEESLAGYLQGKEGDRVYIGHEIDDKTNDITFYLYRKVFNPETGAELEPIRIGISDDELGNVLDYLNLKTASVTQLRADLQAYAEQIASE